MPKKKELKDLTSAELDNQARKFNGKSEDIVFIQREKDWKPEVHPEQED